METRSASITAFLGRRWLCMAAALVICICAGFGYAWSVLQNPIVTQFGWADSGVALAYRNFAKVYSLINPCISIIRVFSFSALAVSMAITGSLSGAYAVFVVLAFVAAGLILLINDKKYADGKTTC